jgi:hypothetical protein
MWWPAISALGFLLLVALDMMLARSGTARWEREAAPAGDVPATSVADGETGGEPGWSAPVVRP